MRKASNYKWLLMMASIPALVVMVGCGVDSDLGEYNHSREGEGVELTNEYSSPSELGPGDIMYINFDESDRAVVDFSGVESSAKFVLAVGSVNEGGASTSIALSNIFSIAEEDESTAVNKDTEYTAEEILSAWLRAAEQDLSLTEPVPEGVTLGTSKAVLPFKAMSSKAIEVGDSESFRVLSSLSSTTSYTSVNGSARCVGSSVVFYVDPRVSSSDLSESDIATLCEGFDSIAAEEQNLFGAISDINGDGRLAVLMTPQINRLGSMGGGIITGYFWAGDLYAQSPSNPVSNYREVIYTMVPDPDGTYGVAVSKDFTLDNLLPAVLPHELQHAISYNQHVFVNGGSPEENWLNEGLSHLAEDLMGYGQENPSRYALYLSNSEGTALVTQSQPDLYERGASYLFLRYLYEQASSAEDFLRNIEDTSSTGVDNLERAFNGGENFSEFHEFFARWAVALALTDQGVTQDARYIYRARVLNSVTGHYKGVCLDCEASDDRGTVLSGVAASTYYGGQTASVLASAVKFYNVESVPDTITLNGTTDGGNFGVLIRQE